MLVMLANNTGWDAGVLFGRYPEHVGHLYSPGAGRKPNFMPPYALDNGRFTAKEKGWDEAKFWKLIESHGPAARWVVVPDIVGDRDGTLREWDLWAPRLSGLTLAMAVQDGMTAKDVPKEASVVFVGGSTNWKRQTLNYWPKAAKRRVHVGRINTERWLWRCLHAGVESCDGTGWLRGDKAQWAGLVRFLRMHSAGQSFGIDGQGTLFDSSPGGRDCARSARSGVSKPSADVEARARDAGSNPPRDKPALGQDRESAA